MDGADSVTNCGAKNYLKIRDDHEPAEFYSTSDGIFQFKDGSNVSWIGDNEFGYRELRLRIEPWLTALFQSEHLSLLTGSGLTHAVHCIATGKKAAGMNLAEFSECGQQINQAAADSAEKAGRSEPNIEDQIRTANELLSGLEILQDTRAGTLRSDLDKIMDSFSKSILESEKDIVEANNADRQAAFDCLVNFLMSFASRTGTRDRLNIFSTNYDRLIEAGSEIAGIHLIDRFVGTLTPIFRSSRLDIDMHYNPPGIRGEPRYLEGVVHFTKLHGSLDWVQVDDTIRRIGLPFGAKDKSPFMEAVGLTGVDNRQLMIYPNAAKDRETAGYPYVEMFRDFAAAICRPNSTLVTYGYGFGDEHINRVIMDMLTIPSTHLVIISYDDPLGRIKEIYKKRSSQISLLIGPDLADITKLTEYYLPKPAIDKATIRMSELIKQRFGAAEEAQVIKGDDK